MEFPGQDAVTSFVDTIAYPPFAQVRYSPESPAIASVSAATKSACSTLITALPQESTVGVCVGSRGIDAIERIVRTVVEELTEAGHTPIILPAMGSHGGATASGQRALLAELGITENDSGCPIDASMETKALATDPFPVIMGERFLEMDAVIPINRIKPHTGFTGQVESGLCKMLAVGCGKHRGAQQFHRLAAVHGFEPVLRNAIAEITSTVFVPGGIGIVENWYDDVAMIEPVPGDSLIEEEATLLAHARELKATLPTDSLDMLVIDEIGKDIAGTGMDTTLIGRSDRVYDGPTSDTSIERIVVRGLSPGSHGNVNGVGLADVVHRDVLEDADLTATYANVLTSGALRNGALPVVMPTDASALAAAVRSLGDIDPASLRIAWIQNTANLASLHLSQAVVDSLDDPALTIDAWEALHFAEGEAYFEARRED